jgi:hypothetical protein
MQLATSAPDMHNMYEVFRDMYEALGVRDIDRVLKTNSRAGGDTKGSCSGKHRCSGSDPAYCF